MNILLMNTISLWVLRRYPKWEIEERRKIVTGGVLFLLMEKYVVIYIGLNLKGIIAVNEFFEQRFLKAWPPWR